MPRVAPRAGTSLHPCDRDLRRRCDDNPVADFETVGPAVAIALRADRSAIDRTRNDLAYITAEVVDQAGRLVPDAVTTVEFEVAGVAELAAAGSANPKDVFSFRRPSPKTFHGRALAIVRPWGEAGTVTVRASAGGLAGAVLSLRVQ